MSNEIQPNYMINFEKKDKIVFQRFYFNNNK